MRGGLVILGLIAGTVFLPGPAHAQGPVPELEVPLTQSEVDRSGMLEAWLTRPIVGFAYGALLTADFCCSLLPVGTGILGVALEFLSLGILSASSVRMSGGNISLVNHLTIIGGTLGALATVGIDETVLGLPTAIGAMLGSVVGLGLAASLKPGAGAGGIVGAAAVLGALAGMAPGLVLDDVMSTMPSATAWLTAGGVLAGTTVGLVFADKLPWGRARVQYLQLGMGIGAGVFGFFAGIAFIPAGVVWGLVTLGTVLGGSVGFSLAGKGKWERLAPPGLAFEGLGVVVTEAGWAPVLGGRF